MRRHLFSLGWELKLSYMSSILLSSLPSFFRLWQETNMADALRHLDKVTIELFTHDLFHFKRKSMSILQGVMTLTIHRNVQAFLWRRLIWLEPSNLYIRVTVVRLAQYNIFSLFVLLSFFFNPLAFTVSISLSAVQIILILTISPTSVLWYREETAWLWRECGMYRLLVFCTLTWGDPKT